MFFQPPHVMRGVFFFMVGEISMNLGAADGSSVALSIVFYFAFPSL
jgi:hypothetical protein